MTQKKDFNPEPLLSVHELSFNWRKNDPPVLEEISFDLFKGQLTGIIGPNGAGKSTLLRLCGGLLKASSGDIRFLNKSLSLWKREEFSRKAAFISQEIQIPFGFSVEELVLMGRAPHMNSLGLVRPDDIKVMQESLNDLELQELSSRPLDCLSGGERQRAFIARALAQQPVLLLCDEPTAHLDLYHQEKLLVLLRKRAVDNNMAVMVAIHDLNLAANACDNLLVLNRSIVARGPPEKVIQAEILEKVYCSSLVTGIDPKTGKRYVLPDLL